MQRRDFLSASAGLLAAGALRAAEKPIKRSLLGFSLYGMRTLTPAEGIQACAKIGYECTELPLMADWPADSDKLTLTSLDAIRAASAKHRLPIVALMENLKLSVDDAQHQRNLARLLRACEFAYTLSPDAPPLIETVLGGPTHEWDAHKEAMAVRLKDWAKVAAEAKITLAIKGHVNNAAHLPEHVVWLVDRVKSDYVRAAYDYSHFQLQGRTLEDSLSALLPQTAFIHVKDAVGDARKFKFVLPGEGATDYAAYFRLLEKQSYRGPVVVEVSGQVHSQAGYDPIAAAQRCYKTLSAAREAAG